MKQRTLNALEAVADFFLDSLLGIMVIAFGFVATMIWLGNVFLLAPSCERTADLYRLEHHYSFLTGCNVLVDGEFRSIDNVRVVIDE